MMSRSGIEIEMNMALKMVACNPSVALLLFTMHIMSMCASDAFAPLSLGFCGKTCSRYPSRADSFHRVDFDCRGVSSSSLCMSVGGSGPSDPPPPPASNSGFFGNQRPPTASEMSTLDEMITKLSEAPAYELPGAVSRSIKVVGSPRFFVRIAERVDMAEDEKTKEKLRQLADNLAMTVSTVVSTTEERLDEKAAMVEKIVVAAAEDDGEFLVPLSASKSQSLRDAVEALDDGDLDEGFLTTVDSWMDKSQKDGLDGMVVILQKVLQCYSGVAVKRSRSGLSKLGAEVAGVADSSSVASTAAAASDEETPAGSVFLRLLSSDAETWDSILNESLKEGIVGTGTVAAGELLGEVQKTIEGCVLGLENGSMRQRVQAEFLRELVTRIEAVRAKSST